MKPAADIRFYEDWRLTSPFSIVFIAIKRFRLVVRSVLELVLLGGLTVIVLRFLDVGLVTGIIWYAGVVLVFVVVSALLSYLVLRISISDEGIAMKSGVFRRSHKMIPWDKIRSVSLESGPIERMLKLTSVSVDTASSAKAEITIPAVPFYVGNFLKSNVQELAKAEIETCIDEVDVSSSPSSGTVDGTLFSLAGKNMLIAAVCAKRLFVSTVFGVGLLMSIVANGFIIYVQLNLAEDSTAIDTSLSEEVQEHIAEEISTSINFFPALWESLTHLRKSVKSWSTTTMLLVWAVMWISPIVVLIPSLAIGLIINALVFYITNKDYELTLQQSQLINERGLITRKTTTLDIPNVQILKVVLNIRSMFYNRLDVTVQQSVEDITTQLAGGNKAHQIDIPSVKMPDLLDFAENIFPEVSHFPPLDPRSKKIRRFSITYCLIGLTGTIFATLSWGTTVFWLMMGAKGTVLATLTLVPIAALVWLQMWRRTGYAFSKDFVVLRKGFLGSELQAVPVEKIHEVTISQSLIQRLRNRCSVLFFVHSNDYEGSLKIPFLDKTFAEQVRDYVLYRIESSTVRWR